MIPEVAGSSPVGRPFFWSGRLSALVAILLGLMQGITEFLPISSSGHLYLLRLCFGVEGNYLLFDTLCHLGTLVAIVVVLAADVGRALRDAKTLFFLLLATLPLVPMVLFLRQVAWLHSASHLLGPFFLLTALLLYLGERKVNRPLATSWRQPLVIGAFQVFGFATWHLA